MSHRVYRFDSFTVDTRLHVLLREGVRLPIQEQPFQVLLAMLENPGVVITRELLRFRLWGNDTFVDFDQSLNSALRRLRIALRDNPRRPVFIETVPRVGFRFLMAVRVETSAAVLSGNHVPTPESARGAMSKAYAAAGEVKRLDPQQLRMSSRGPAQPIL